MKWQKSVVSSKYHDERQSRSYFEVLHHLVQSTDSWTFVPPSAWETYQNVPNWYTSISQLLQSHDILCSEFRTIPTSKPVFSD
jgi:hypothetical protein